METNTLKMKVLSICLGVLAVMQVLILLIPEVQSLIAILAEPVWSSEDLLYNLAGNRLFGFISVFLNLAAVAVCYPRDEKAADPAKLRRITSGALIATAWFFYKLLLGNGYEPQKILIFLLCILPPLLLHRHIMVLFEIQKVKTL